MHASHDNGGVAGRETTGSHLTYRSHLGIHPPWGIAEREHTPPALMLCSAIMLPRSISPSIQSLPQDVAAETRHAKPVSAATLIAAGARDLQLCAHSADHRAS